MQQEVIDSIVEIKFKSTNENIPIKSKEILFETSKYASTKTPIWQIYINNVRMVKESDMIINYNCSECEKTYSVDAVQFLRKLRAGTHKCRHCALEFHNLQPEHNKSKNRKKLVKPSLAEFHELSINEFESYPDDYKSNYLLSHLSEEDFDRLRPNIISICNGKYTDIKDFEYWSIYKVHNQMAFSSVLYDKNTKSIIKIHQPIMKCDICDNIWRAKSLDGFKNAYKVLCKDCKFCNSIFKLRPTININNDKIMYQSKLEKKFIDWCSNNNLLVINGPKIKYNFGGRNRIYKVDFQINELLIEIKDFHIWHKNQVESGKWKAKEDAANYYITENNYKKFLLITPKNWNELTNEILQLNKI